MATGYVQDVSEQTDRVIQNEVVPLVVEIHAVGNGFIV